MSGADLIAKHESASRSYYAAAHAHNAQPVPGSAERVAILKVIMDQAARAVSKASP